MNLTQLTSKTIQSVLRLVAVVVVNSSDQPLAFPIQALEKLCQIFKSSITLPLTHFLDFWIILISGKFSSAFLPSFNGHISHFLISIL